MTQVRDIMTRAARSISPHDSLQHAARLMQPLDVGALPVVEHGQLVAIVSLADLARRQRGHIDRVVREVSAPQRPGALPQAAG